VTLNSCKIFENQATEETNELTTGGGGGIRYWGDDEVRSLTTLTLTDCDIYYNKANADGGGAYIEYTGPTTVTFIACRIYKNSNTKNQETSNIVAGPDDTSTVCWFDAPLPEGASRGNILVDCHSPPSPPLP